MLNNLAALSGGGVVIPTTPTSGSAIWLDASDASTFTFSSGSVVSQWNDKSGNSRNFSQGTVANQPSRTGSRNGLSTVVFDGTNDRMQATSATTNYTSWSLFVVSYSNSSSTQRILGKRNAEGSDETYGAVWYTSKLFALARNLSSGVNASLVDGSLGIWLISTNGSSANTGALRLLSQTVTNNTDTKVRFQGANLASATAGSQAVTNTVNPYIGALNVSGSFFEFLNGEIAEMLLYPSALSDADREQTETYLKNKWGL
jgi:hypothetical protein